MKPPKRSALSLSLLPLLACAGEGGSKADKAASPEDTSETEDSAGSEDSADTPDTADTSPTDDTSETADTGEAETCLDTASPLTWPVDFATVGIYGWGGPGLDYGVDVNYTKVLSAGTALSDTLPNVPIVYPFAGDDLETAKTNLDAMLASWDLSTVDYLILGEEHTTYEEDVLTGLYEHVKLNWPDAPPVLQWMSPANYEPYTAIPADGWVMDSYGVDGETYRRWVMKHVVTGGRVLLCIWASEEGGVYGDFDAMSPSTEDQVGLAREFNLPMFFFAVDWDGASVGAWWSSDDEDTTRWRDWYEALRGELATVDTTLLPEASANHSSAEPRQVAPDELGAYSFSEPFSTPDFIDDASIEGFLNLRWDPTAGALLVEPKPGLANQSCGSSLTWAYTSETDISGVSVALSGTLTGEGSVVLALSTDGETWSEVSATGEGPFALSVTGPDEPATTLHVRVTGMVPPEGDDAVALDLLTVGADVALPEPGLDLTLTDGAASWTDDFTSQAYLHEAEIGNPDALIWQEAEHVYIDSVTGTSNYATLTYAVTTDAPARTITAGYGGGYANWSSWASYNTVTIVDTASGASASDSTTNYEAYTDVNDNYWGPISATLSLSEGTTSFTVSFGMYSISGVAKSYTNELDDLTIVVAE